MQPERVQLGHGTRTVRPGGLGVGRRVLVGSAQGARAPSWSRLVDPTYSLEAWGVGPRPWRISWSRTPPTRVSGARDARSASLREQP